MMAASGGGHRIRNPPASCPSAFGIPARHRHKPSGDPERTLAHSEEAVLHASSAAFLSVGLTLLRVKGFTYAPLHLALEGVRSFVSMTPISATAFLLEIALDKLPNLKFAAIKPFLSLEKSVPNRFVIPFQFQHSFLKLKNH